MRYPEMVKTSPATRARPREFDGSTPAETAIFEAMEQLLRVQPLQDVTVAMILAEAGLSRANFYHYFANKFDVVAALVYRLFDDSYASAAPWASAPGKSRAKSIGASLQRTLDLWSQHGAVICAVIEHMHSVPAIAKAWRSAFDRFVATVAEQIEHERQTGAAPAGTDAESIATMLVCGVERTFYVGSRRLDPRLPTPDDAVESLVALNFSAIYGRHPQTGRSAKKTRQSKPGPIEVPDIAPLEIGVEAPNPTAESILRATSELLLEGSLDELSVARILERADASRATFYFYFANKDEAFIALFRAAAAQVVSGMQRLAEFDREHPEQIAAMVASWLDLDDMTMAVIRNAVHEWPRRPELRNVYLASVNAMAGYLERMIEGDRAAGIAVDGPSAPQFAASLIWTIERTVAGALANEEHLEDFESVKAMLGTLMTSAIYGR